MSHRPLVLVHGLWNRPSLFDPFLKRLNQPNRLILIPFLPHQLGRVSLNLLAEQLDRVILRSLGAYTNIDLLGFSMGGLISRLWLQKFGGSIRTNRFISVGSPHNGTLTAQLIPKWLLAGVSEMKRGSSLLKDLNNDVSTLKEVSCSSFFSRWDLMVFPGSSAVLPVGNRFALQVLTHRALITHTSALDAIKEVLIAE